MERLSSRPTINVDVNRADNNANYYGKPFTQREAYQSSLNYITSPRSISKHGMVSRNTTASAVRLAVFNTPELLENILSHLPETQLLLTRRVTIYWNALIITSPRLRRKLFLNPEPIRTSWTIEGIHHDAVQVTSENGNKQPAYLTLPAKLNPMLFTTAPSHARHNLMHRVQEAERIYFLSPFDLNRKDVIHRSMLVCQPPAKQLTIDIEFRLTYKKQKKTKKRSANGQSLTFQPYFLRGRSSKRAYHIHRDVRNAHGVTFGDVVKAFRAGVKAKGLLGRKGDGWKVSISAEACSFLRMSGVVFATEKEKEMVRLGLL